MCFCVGVTKRLLFIRHSKDGRRRFFEFNLQTFTLWVGVTCFSEGFDQAPGMRMSNSARFVLI